MIKSGYSTTNESLINTYISKEDKISLAKLKKEIESYPINTYLRYCTKGAINDLSSYTYGLIKVEDDKWAVYSSLYGASDKFLSNKEVLSRIINSKSKNIGVKLPK